MVGWVDIETIWFVCPVFAGVFEWCEALQCPQAACIVVERWPRKFEPFVKADRMTKEVIQNEETKEPFA